MKGTLFTPAPDGGLVSTDGRYVRKYNANLRALFHFGGTGTGAHPVAGQFDFYLQGAAVQLRDGRYLVADAGHGLELFSSSGNLLGTLTDAQLGLLTQRDALTLDGGTLYLATGGPFSAAQRVSRMPLASAVSQALAPGPSTPPLGIGAGVRLSAAASYFAARHAAVGDGGVRLLVVAAARAAAALHGARRGPGQTWHRREPNGGARRRRDPSRRPARPARCRSRSI